MAPAYMCLTTFVHCTDLYIVYSCGQPGTSVEGEKYQLFKGQYHEIFKLWSFRERFPHEPLIYTRKKFLIKIQIFKDMSIQNLFQEVGFTWAPKITTS
jgi:hypothetical protein